MWSLDALNSAIKLKRKKQPTKPWPDSVNPSPVAEEHFC